MPGTGGLPFSEVKGHVSGAVTLSVTRNEILYSLNKPDDFILAIVEFNDHSSHRLTQRSRAMTTIRIELGPEAAVALRKPIVGQGGFQSLLRALQSQIADENVLMLTPRRRSESAGMCVTTVREVFRGGWTL